jgi:hypothetical protein
MIRAWLLVALASGGCSAAANFRMGSTSPSTGGGGPSASGAAVVPNVVLLPRGQAEAVLRSAGFTEPVNFDTSACGSTVDNKTVVELGQVCYQMPAAGREASPRLPVTLRVQHEDPWRGRSASGRAWFLMPDLAGMPLATARARLRALGFAKEPLISFVQEPGCRPNVVCRSSPDPLSRADTSSDKVLVVGQTPAPAQSPTPITAPTRAPTDSPPSSPPPPAKGPADIF